MIDKRRVHATARQGDATVKRAFGMHGLARTSELERAGINRTQLGRLVRERLVERVGRGLYALPGRRGDERDALAEATRRVPGGVVCLLSALRFHGLTTQNPYEVWMAVPHKAWRPQTSYPPLRLVFLSDRILRSDVERHDVGGVSVPVFSAARTVADCFKFRNKIGVDVAIEALRDYYRRFPKGLDAVWEAARLDRVSGVIRPYLESLE